MSESHHTGGGPDLKPLALKPWTQLLILVGLAGCGAAGFWYLQGRDGNAVAATSTSATSTSATSTSATSTPAAVTPVSIAPRTGFQLTKEQLATLTVEPVETRQFYEEILTEGKVGVDEYRSTPVFSPYPGRVVTIFARTGEHVEQGQKLFSVQANEMVQAQNDYLAALNVLNKARSQLTYAQNAEKRLHDLYDSRVTTLRELQSAQNDLATATNDQKTAEVGLEAVKNRLRILGLKDTDMTALSQKGVISPETMINAPLAGTIIQRKIGPGQYVNTGGGDPSYVIGDLSEVWLIAQLREPDVAKVDLGERLRFRVLAYPDKTFEGKIDFIGAAVDPTTRRVYVRAQIDNSAGLLKPEMYASVRIISDHESSSASVPRPAVIFEGDRASVWVLGENDMVENRRIKPGILNGTNLEVVEGLKAGERVITKGSLFVDRMATPG